MQKELASGDHAALEFGARSLVDRLALCLAASVLIQDGDPTVAKCFLRTRLPLSGATCIPVHNLGAATSILDKDDIEHLISRMKVLS